jgi:formylmethanofuran dehydrogenase subunit E
LEGEEMTLLQIEDALTDEEELALQNGLTVKCSWCGEIIHLDGEELALAMCQACYERMLAEFMRAQQMNRPDSHASDR